MILQKKKITVYIRTNSKKAGSGRLQCIVIVNWVEYKYKI